MTEPFGQMTSKVSLHLSELFSIGFGWKFIGELVILRPIDHLKSLIDWFSRWETN